MNKNLSRLVLSLAGMNLRPSELRQLIVEIQMIHPEEIINAVMYASEFVLKARQLDMLEEPDLHSRSSYRLDNSVGDRVERLLKIEAGLGTQDAYEKLKKTIVQYGHMRSKDVPPLSKKSLSYWVDRLLDVVPEKEILRLATLIRNDTVHSPQTDWKLGRGDAE